jgi:ABC-type nickel/cobalt efflux system permease component RcnA
MKTIYPWQSAMKPKSIQQSELVFWVSIGLVGGFFATALLAIVLVVVFANVSVWTELDSEIQGSLVGAIATVLTATIGVLLVVWQIGRQARHAIQQNRHNEALKLKLQVYKEVAAKSRAAGFAESDLSSYVRIFETEVELARSMRTAGGSWVPKARFPILSEKNNSLSEKTIEIVSMTERWQIIDPRIELFRMAIGAAMEDIRQTFDEYIKIVLPLLPMEISVPSHQGTLFPWHPPDDQSAQHLKQVSEDFLEALGKLGCFIYDIQVEMQNLLLGELFDNVVSSREPLDPRYTVLRLDRHKELAHHFDKETKWGSNKAKAEARAQADLTKTP